MKLRIQGNSLRLRLNQAEVAQFSKTGYVEETIQFGPGSSFSYVLESNSKLEVPQALFLNNELRVQMPAGAANDWVTTDRVGVTGEQAQGGAKRLSIMIEKDFKCLHGDDVDPNAYPNPLEQA